MMEDVNSETNSINYKSALTKTVPSIDGQTNAKEASKLSSVKEPSAQTKPKFNYEPKLLLNYPPNYPSVSSVGPFDGYYPDILEPSSFDELKPGVVDGDGPARKPNNPEFRRNFRSLVDWNKPPRVALLETKMQDHLVLLNDFSFNRVIEVPTIGNAGGLEVLSDDFIVDLSDVALSYIYGSTRSNG
ncbi:hypothetical protein BC332_03988 [Capsicum chinense]|nr:hypothetical protein BC332_03988 [Capsicum chinense]